MRGVGGEGGDGGGGNVNVTLRSWMWVRAVNGMGIFSPSCIKKFKTFLRNIILQHQENLSILKKEQNYTPCLGTLIFETRCCRLSYIADPVFKGLH